MEHSGRHQRGNGRLHYPVAAFNDAVDILIPDYQRYLADRRSNIAQVANATCFLRFSRHRTSRFFSISTKGEGFSLLNSAIPDGVPGSAPRTLTAVLQRREILNRWQ